MNHRAREGEQEAGACLALNRPWASHSFSHSSQSPPSATLTRGGSCLGGARGRGTGRGGAGAASPEPGGKAGSRRAPKGAQGTPAPQDAPPRPHVTRNESTFPSAQSWSRQVLGPCPGQAEPTLGPRSLRAGDPASRTVAPGLGRRPAALPLPHPARQRSPPPAAPAAARPAPRVPTGSASRVRGRGPGWAAWPAPESAAPARSPRPGPARGRAAACRHPGQGSGPARAPSGPAPFARLPARPDLRSCPRRLGAAHSAASSPGTRRVTVIHTHRYTHTHTHTHTRTLLRPKTRPTRCSPGRVGVLWGSRFSS